MFHPLKFRDPSWFTLFFVCGQSYHSGSSKRALGLVVWAHASLKPQFLIEKSSVDVSNSGGKQSAGGGPRRSLLNSSCNIPTLFVKVLPKAKTNSSATFCDFSLEMRSAFTLATFRCFTSFWIYPEVGHQFFYRFSHQVTSLAFRRSTAWKSVESALEESTMDSADWKHAQSAKRWSHEDDLLFFLWISE